MEADGSKKRQTAQRVGGEVLPQEGRWLNTDAAGSTRRQMAQQGGKWRHEKADG